MLKKLLLAAAIAVAPFAASAITININANGTTASAGPTSPFASYFGNLNGFNLAITASNLGNPSTSQLSSNSISATGIGTLVVTTMETYNFGINPLRITGMASVSDSATSIMVDHFINLGAGFVSVANLDFGNGTGSLSGSILSGNSGTFQLKSVFTIVTSGLDSSANVNADVVAGAVPLPAAGWMLLAGLGGLAVAKRRKKS